VVARDRYAGAMLLSLSNVPRDYAWGSASLLAELEGRTPTGSPEAEVWFGDHPGDPADVAGGSTLDAVTGGKLPYLLKLLAAADPLSIQVHPTIEQARDGWAREAALAADDPTRNYRDDNHKPELIVALSERFEALSGLRPVEATLRLLAELGESDGVAELRKRLSGDGSETDADVLRDALAWLLSGTAQSAVDDITAAVADASSEEFAAELTAVRAIAERNPGDPGVVVALLMNFIVLARGEGIFLRAGLLHAYVSGLGVEIMAASDNVLRGGLTSKHIDVPELLRAARFDTRAPEVLALDERSEVRGTTDDFILTVLSDVQDRALSRPGPLALLCTSGSFVLDTGEKTLRLEQGEAVFVGADEPRPAVT